MGPLLSGVEVVYGGFMGPLLSGVEVVYGGFMGPLLSGVEVRRKPIAPRKRFALGT